MSNFAVFVKHHWEHCLARKFTLSCSDQPFQSGFQPQHSTENANINKVLNIDESKISPLLLLDLSVAFDTVDKNMTDWRCGTFLKGAKYTQMFLRTLVLVIVSLNHAGVPQGCILGTLSFNLYMLPQAQIM